MGWWVGGVIVWLESESFEVVIDNLSHPGCTVACVSSHEDEAMRARQQLLADWEILQKCERLQHKSFLLRQILAEIDWTRWEWVRLYMHLNEAELRGGKPPTGDASAVHRCLLPIHVRIPDEKGGEDLHQFVRDETRRRRFKKLTPQRISYVVTTASIPSDRGMPQLSVPPATFESMSARDKHESMDSVFFGSPKHWSPALNKTLKTDKGDSHSEAAQAAAVSSWRWIREYFTTHAGAHARRPLICGMVAKLCLERHAMWAEGHGYHAVIASWPWSILRWSLDLVYADANVQRFRRDALWRATDQLRKPRVLFLRGGHCLFTLG